MLNRMLIDRTLERGTGIPSIDTDLDAIFEAINQASACAARRDAVAALRERLERLLSLIQRHFIKEQGVMAISLYPYYSDHRSEHEAFLADFRSMVSRRGGRKCLDGAVSFALKFIVAHRRLADVRLADFLALNAHYLRPSYIPIRTLQYTAVHRI